MPKKKSGTKRKADSNFDLRRSKRIKNNKADKLKSLRSGFSGKLDHFGPDVSDIVDLGTNAQGRTTEDEREEGYKRVKSHTIVGKSLESVLPKPLVDQINDSFENESIIQKDMREDPRKGGKYKGVMLTTTFVNPPSPKSKEKEIPRPISPRPKSFGKGMIHAAHTSPFSLGGIDTNDTKTVNAPQTANLVFDAHIEKRLKKAHNAGNKVVHGRLDSHNRSTVFGVIKEKSGYKTIAAQYKRR